MTTENKPDQTEQAENFHNWDIESKGYLWSMYTEQMKILANWYANSKKLHNRMQREAILAHIEFQADNNMNLMIQLVDEFTFMQWCTSNQFYYTIYKLATEDN